MKIIDTIKRAGRSLRQAKTRTLLTSLAIGVGAFTITLSLAAGAGGRNYTTEIINANISTKEIYVYYSDGEDSQLSSAPQEYNDSETSVSNAYVNGDSISQLLQQSDIDKLGDIDGVASVAPAYNVSIKYITRGDNQSKYQGSISTFSDTISQEYVAGSGENIADNGVLLPDSYLEVLGFDNAEAAIGQTIQVSVASSYPGQPDKVFDLKIVGVTKESILRAAFSGTMADLQVDSEVAKAMHQYVFYGTPLSDSYYYAIVAAETDDDVLAVKQALEDQGYSGQTAEDMMSFIFQFVNVLQGILIGFGALAILTSIFGIINTQYISVLERTQQIGLMKALGMRRRDVGRLFRFEAAWIGFLGGAIGAGLAFLFGTLANPWINSTLGLPDNMYLLIFQPISIIAVVVSLMVIAVVAGIFPARKAAKLDPIEALRTE